MSVELQWDGLKEFLETLRTFPEDISAEATPLVVSAAEGARVETTTAYQGHRRTGNLAEHVRMEQRALSKYGAWCVVRSGARHAYLFEVGTVPRFYNTASGARHDTGSMPPANIFVPAAVRWRRQMYVEIADLLRRHGAIVTGI